MTAVAPTLTTSLNPCPSVSIYVPALTRTNLVSNPSFEVNTGGWYVGGNATLAQSTAQAFVGSASMSMTSIAAGNMTAALGSNPAVTAGLNYWASGYFYAATSARGVSVNIDWYGASGYLSTTAGTPVSDVTTGWTRVSVYGAAPTNATYAQLVFRVIATGAAGEVHYLDGVLFEQTTTLGSYFEGGPGTTPDSLTVWRQADGLTEPVRNANAISANTSFLVTDYEAPIGITVSYWVETFASGVSLGVSDTSTTTVNDARMWITDPLNPRNSMAIQLGGYGTATLGRNTFESIKRTYRFNKSVVLGKARPVMQFYGQKGIEGAHFEVLTHDAGDIAMENLISVAPVLIRVPAAMPNLPARLYGIMEPEQQPQSWRFESANQLTLWSINFTETEPQSLSIVFSVYSYAYWAARYGSYAYVSLPLATYNANTYLYSAQNPPA